VKTNTQYHILKDFTGKEFLFSLNDLDKLKMIKNRHVDEEGEEKYHFILSYNDYLITADETTGIQKFYNDALDENHEKLKKVRNELINLRYDQKYEDVKIGGYNMRELVNKFLDTDLKTEVDSAILHAIQYKSYIKGNGVPKSQTFYEFVILSMERMAIKDEKRSTFKRLERELLEIYKIGILKFFSFKINTYDAKDILKKVDFTNFQVFDSKKEIENLTEEIKESKKRANKIIEGD